MPLAFILILASSLEASIRIGFWDKYLKPSSFLGYAMNRFYALKEFGLDNVHWITLGDSTTDWGINHELIFKNQKKYKLNHLRMSFPQSSLFTYQTASAWSMANMSNLKGIMLGVSDYKLSRFSSPDRHLSISWPFRQFADYDSYQYTEGHNDFLSRILSNFSLFTYFPNIKDFLNNPVLRFKEISSNSQQSHPGIFLYNRSSTNNLCDHQVNTLGECITAAKQIMRSGKKMTPAEKRIVKYCASSSAQFRQAHPKYKPKIPEEQILAVTKNWIQLFDYLAKQPIQIKLLLLPEHPFNSYYLKYKGNTEMVTKIIHHAKKFDNIQILDLRTLFHPPSYNTCEYYIDFAHFNNNGNEIITDKVISWLNETN